ncbi:MAG: DNA polymerase III subunit alpha [Dermatophilaceae bacterium]
MRTPFVHLHVASSSSMQYGVSGPADLVAAAAADGQRILALTDRDGVYGMVRFARACAQAGVAPVLGVDLAIEEESPPAFGVPNRDVRGVRPPHGGAPGGETRRTPVRGGLPVDDYRPRVTVLARGAAAGLLDGAGWARLCRLVTATHLRGIRGRPVATRASIAEHSAEHAPGCEIERAAGPGAGAALVVLLGPDSDVGRALAARRVARAEELLGRWREALPAGSLVIELTCHGGPPGTRGSDAHCADLIRLARRAGIPTVLTAAVRHVAPEQAVVVDLLDAARRLVPLAERHLDRLTTAGHLASTARMEALATDLMGPSEGRELLRRTLALGVECVQRPREDLGIGSVHLPEGEVLGLAPGDDAQRVLAERCRGAVATRYADASAATLAAVAARLDAELAVIETLGYPTYFLTVAVVVDLIRARDVRVAARGSGAGSLVNYLLGVSGVEPLAHGLLMERFCTTLRAQLPDIDIDTESARRTEIYEAILERFGAERVSCVSMMETYRVRHAIRDVGAALGLPPVEIDAMAKAFPHIRARDARSAIAELPELAASGFGSPRLECLWELVEALDGLPRHIALHPCGVLLSDAGLLDRTPVESSWLGFPMSQFDKDDVEAIGLLKLDVLGIRMQSAMAHSLREIERVEGRAIDLDDRAQVALDDPTTFELIRSTRTLGCFQIESPGQRELIGKFAPETFEDLIIDISLFRPGPVKSDMVTPFLRARQGWQPPDLLHPSLTEALAPTCGVVVFHEQVLQILAISAGISLAEADEVRRALGSRDGQERVEAWWRPLARRRGYSPADADRIWAVLAAFASFGFCKAHAAAFALPTFQSAWLKAHHPAAFFAGVLTHDPGMYPQRLILDDARVDGVTILPLDVNASVGSYRVECCDDADELGLRMSLSGVKGIHAEEVERIVASAPYEDLDDFWRRARASRPVTERLVLAGAFDALYGLDPGRSAGLGRRGRISRRDLLLHVAELDRWSRATAPAASRARGRSSRTGGERVREDAPVDIRAAAAAQSRAAVPVTPAGQRAAQLTLDLGGAPVLTATGLPELTRSERVRAELDILGLDVSEHVVASYAAMLADLGVVSSKELRTDARGVRNRSEILVAGVKVATQTPPIRSGRRVVFLTLDDATGPVDATFFEDVQGSYAATVFHSWLLLVRGVVRRTGPKGVSLRATGAWELSGLAEAWRAGGARAVEEIVEASPRPEKGAASKGSAPRAGEAQDGADPDRRGTRRVLVHPSGFRQSPYADVLPPGTDTRSGRGLPTAGQHRPGHADDLHDGASPRKLWHSSPGSAGH